MRNQCLPSKRPCTPQSLYRSPSLLAIPPLTLGVRYSRSHHQHHYHHHSPGFPMSSTNWSQHVLDGIQRDASLLRQHGVLSQGNWTLIQKILQDPGRDVAPPSDERQPHAPPPPMPTRPNDGSSLVSKTAVLYPPATKQQPPVPPRPGSRQQEGMTAETEAMSEKRPPVIPPRPSKRHSADMETVQKEKRSPSLTTPSEDSKKDSQGGNGGFAKQLGNTVAHAAAGGVGWAVGTGIVRKIF